LVISDVDGTITRTDLRGILTTALRVKAGGRHKAYAHRGICKLYNRIVDTCGCRVIYLTARPIRLMNETRAYVTALQQQEQRLPAGAVVSDTTKYMGAVRREVIHKSSHVFKIAFLNQIRSCFQQSGRDVERDPLFLACFGNKPTDATAYVECGAHEETTFMITKRSTISAVSGRHNDLKSYSDPVLGEWLDHLWAKHRPALHRGRRPEGQQRTMSL
jgi:phosphatidate phosphatase PAH1